MALGPFSLTSIFFFNDTATTEIYTLSLHDALPISHTALPVAERRTGPAPPRFAGSRRDRKSTRLNSSHVEISYAVFCLKKTLTPTLRTPRGGCKRGRSSPAGP